MSRNWDNAVASVLQAISTQWKAKFEVFSNEFKCQMGVGTSKKKGRLKRGELKDKTVILRWDGMEWGF